MLRAPDYSFTNELTFQMACDIKKLTNKVINESINMVNFNKLKSLPPSFFILYLIVAFHAPYYHLHIQTNNTHASNHEHYSGSAHYNSEKHSHPSKTNFAKAETLKAGHQNVRRHLHFTRELYRPRKDSQGEPERYNSFALNTIKPVLIYNHTFTITLSDFHKIKHSPESSKTFSGLSPPVA
jgi:hypothetical protein